MNAKSHADLDAEKARLLLRDAEWALAASEGRDVERIVSYWTDDAIVLPPGLAAVVGKTALRQYVHDSMQIPGFKITLMRSIVTRTAAATRPVGAGALIANVTG